jgi:hypothetical protein
MATDRRRKLNQLLRFPDGGLNDCRVFELTDVLAIASTSRPPETTSPPAITRQIVPLTFINAASL